MKIFSEFAKNEGIMDGEKTTVEDILNKEIIILSYKIKDSQYNKTNLDKYLHLQIQLGDVKYVLFTGSKVLIDQMEKYKSEIPFATTIVKIDKYFTFS